MKGSRSQQASPPNSGSDSSSLGSQGTSGSIEVSLFQCVSFFCVCGCCCSC